MAPSEDAQIEYNYPMPPTNEQLALIDLPISSKIFLEGSAGTGKTTAGTLWLKKRLQSGIPAHQILVWTPQRALAQPYQVSLFELDQPAYSLMTTITLGSLARRMVDLFWPVISRDISVAHPNLPPHFLTLETAQYYMAHVVRPMIESEGLFASLTINRNRIYSQILDNLNKAAIVGFPHQEIGDRLKSAWIGDIEQIHIYDDVQVCVNRFRAFCLEYNLLDFSLQVEIFLQHLWPSALCRQYLTRTYRHLIVDNLEEDPPVAHDILREWLPEFESALLIFDENAGYRYFLGADVRSASSLRHSCQQTIRFTQNQINSPAITSIKSEMLRTAGTLSGQPHLPSDLTQESIQLGLETPDEKIKYFPAMVKWVSEKINALITDGVSPSEIVVLAPFMPDVLRFSLANQLDALGIPHRAHRPSRSLREEPATQTILSLAAVSHPGWNLLPKRINLAFALMQAIDGLDLVRSQLLTAYNYKENPGEGDFPLKPFESVPPAIRDRITYRVGERYDHLYDWLALASQQPPETLDFFINRLFGEVLSQPGYGFHNDLESGNTIATLVESVQKFRWAVGTQLGQDAFDIGSEYIQMVQDGVIAASYVHSWETPDDEAVFLFPAYTFLISNRPVDYQFWLDISSPSWYQRLDQPLTQPYVLSRNWHPGDLWDAEDAIQASYDSLQRLSFGLLNRCRKKIFLGMSEVDVRGYENRGLLIRIFQQVFQQAQKGAV